MKKKLVIYWSRRDFRLEDNPALHEAIEMCRATEALFLPLFILEDYMRAGNADSQFGYPSRYIVAKALPAYAMHFSNFLILKGKAAESIITLCSSLTSTYDIEVFVNEDVYIDFYTQVEKIRDAAITVHVLIDQLTVSRETKSEAGNYYSVFTPFKKAVWKEFLQSPVLEKVDLKNIPCFPIDQIDPALRSARVEQSFESLWNEFSKNRSFKAGDTVYGVNELLNFTPDFDLLDTFYYTEEEATKRFAKFLDTTIIAYKDRRDFLNEEGTSRMSIGLAWGLISARTLKSAIQEKCKHDFIEFGYTKEIPDAYNGATHFISELIWREFYKYLLFQNPSLLHTEFQSKFRGTIDWVTGAVAHKRFSAWVQGKTGYPIVDAAMMQLAKSGWMHNRARMVVASVLTKNLGVDWRWGQEYFRAMLLDLDEASNNGGWQWGASVGADPKPIRIFNPYLQAENYDADGLYQKSCLDADYVSSASPLVPHKEAREEALERYGLNGTEGTRSTKPTPVRDY
jgi:deoxyribodipyrimidine photo-lyase